MKAAKQTNNTPVLEINLYDVLSGRGALVNKHPGNVKFVKLVRSLAQAYSNASIVSGEREKLVQSVISTTNNNGGRFLDITFCEMTIKDTKRKVVQCFRDNKLPAKSRLTDKKKVPPKQASEPLKRKEISNDHDQKLLAGDRTLQNLEARPIDERKMPAQQASELEVKSQPKDSQGTETEFDPATLLKENLILDEFDIDPLNTHLPP